jgi:hypothetical protein
MSRSNAAAINRRVNVPAAQTGNSFKPSIVNSTNQSQQPPAVLTLPQVISVFDNRIMLLEKFMIESKHTPITNTTTSENNVETPVTNTTTSENNVQPPVTNTTTSENILQPPVTNTTTSENNVQEKTIFNNIEYVSINDFNTIISEFNSRFELFAHEISELKDIVLKLQLYTMEVNKSLLEEREKIYINSITNNNLANKNEEPVNTNNQSTETIDYNDKNIDSNTSIDLNR